MTSRDSYSHLLSFTRTLHIIIRYLTRYTLLYTWGFPRSHVGHEAIVLWTQHWQGAKRVFNVEWGTGFVQLSCNYLAWDSVSPSIARFSMNDVWLSKLQSDPKNRWPPLMLFRRFRPKFGSLKANVFIFCENKETENQSSPSSSNSKEPESQENLFSSFHSKPNFI